MKTEIKEKVLEEVYKKYDKKNLLFGERKIFNKAIDLTLAEVGKVIDEEKDKYYDDEKSIFDKLDNESVDIISKELKQKLGIK